MGWIQSIIVWVLQQIKWVVKMAREIVVDSIHWLQDILLGSWQQVLDWFKPIWREIWEIFCLTSPIDPEIWKFLIVGALITGAITGITHHSFFVGIRWYWGIVLHIPRVILAWTFGQFAVLFARISRWLRP